MSDQKDSIFDFADKFAVNKQLGNWSKKVTKELKIQFVTYKLKGTDYTISLRITAKNLSSKTTVLKFYQYGTIWDTLIKSINLVLRFNGENEYDFKIKQSEHESLAIEESKFLFEIEADNNSISAETDKFDLPIYDDSDYWAQKFLNPDGRWRSTHKEALVIANEKDQCIAFVMPDMSYFQWVDSNEGSGYFEDGKVSWRTTYDAYVEDKYQRKANPISWGIQLFLKDYVETLIAIVDDPVGAITAFGSLLKKIVTLDFDIKKTWERVISADKTDAAYVFASIFFAFVAGPKKLSVIAGTEVSSFSQIAETVLKSAGKKLSWPELLVLFKKAIAFQVEVSKKLALMYKANQGWIHVKQLYLKFGKTVSVADDVMFNTKTGKIVLNETKYGKYNIPTTNQKVIEDAIKSGKKVEIRSSNLTLDNAGLPKDKFRQGTKIEINEILRSNSLDGKIDMNTIKSLWKKN